MQGGQPTAVFYLFGHPTPYAFGYERIRRFKYPCWQESLIAHRWQEALIARAGMMKKTHEKRSRTLISVGFKYWSYPGPYFMGYPGTP
jgi:hypothetical protein